jgi:putative copper export protein/methionine-rich copper-binding protein CopC
MNALRAVRLIAAVALLAVPSAAGAHGLLRSSSPAADSVLVVPPSEIRLTFTEAPELAFTRVRLMGADGHVFTHPVRVLPGNVAVARIEGRLKPGEYRVEWQTAGDDGHPVSGSFSFTVAAPPGGTTGTAVDSSADHMASPVVHTAGNALNAETDPFAGLAAVLRWLTLLGAVAAIGAIAFRYTVLRRVSLEVDREIETEYLPDADRRAGSLGALAALLLLAASAARFLLQSLAVHGSDEALDPSMLSAMLSQTNWGRAWLMQVIGALIALGGFLVVRRRRTSGWLAAAVGCTLIAVGLARASHAAVVPEFAGLSMAANIVHTIAAAGWLGNLLHTFAVGLPLAWRLDREDRWTVVRDIVHAFSPAALAFGGIAVVTGAFMAWTHVGSISALTGTDYGRVLLLKLGLLATTGTIGAYNWLRVRPALGDHTGARRLRRTAGAELAIAALVLAVTAVLVALPLPTAR